MSDWKNPLPLRILVLSDLGGEGGEDAAPLTAETWDDLLLAVAPKTAFSVPDRLGVGGTHEVELDCSTTAGFHPDTVVDLIPALSKAAELRRALAADGEVDAKALADGAEGTEVKNAVRALVEGEVTEETRAAAVSALDAVIGRQVDEVLHHPDLQKIESTWRGLRVLAEACDGESVRLEVLSVKFAELVDTFRKKVFDPEYAGTEIPLGAVILDFEFDHRAHLLGPLTEMGDLARVLQVSLIASTGPEFFGLKSLVHLGAIGDVGARLNAPVYGNFHKFQTSDAARWTSLTVNRVLLRNLYEPDLGGVSHFAYTESADAAHPNRYLWGSATWLAGVNLARSFTQNGHCAEISGHSGTALHQGLPVRQVSVTSTEKGWCSVEVLMSDMNGNDLAKIGFAPLAGQANGNLAYFPFIANLYRSGPGRLTIDSAVSHQMFAGHLSHYTLKLLADAPITESDDAVAQHFKKGFEEFLGPMGNEESVTVAVGEAEEGEGRMAAISIHPLLQIREKDLDLKFTLPIGG